MSGQTSRSGTDKTARKERAGKPPVRPLKDCAGTLPGRRQTGSAALNCLRERAARIVAELRRTYPDATCTLGHVDPWQLMVAAILAAQSTDARVNQITPALFEAFPDPAAMAAAELSRVEDLIRTCGLYRNKAKALIASSRALLEDFGGTMPRSVDQLLRLPGVGRKIANLIVGDAFGIPGIVVDTHCARISGLIGLTGAEQPARIEQDLENILDPADWIDYGHLMVAHGRAICIARRPRCPICPIVAWCDYGQQATRSD